MSAATDQSAGPAPTRFGHVSVWLDPRVLHQFLKLPDNVHIVHMDGKMFPNGVRLVLESPSLPVENPACEPPYAQVHGTLVGDRVLYEIDLPFPPGDSVRPVPADRAVVVCRAASPQDVKAGEFLEVYYMASDGVMRLRPTAEVSHDA